MTYSQRNKLQPSGVASFCDKPEHSRGTMNLEMRHSGSLLIMSKKLYFSSRGTSRGPAFPAGARAPDCPGVAPPIHVWFQLKSSSKAILCLHIILLHYRKIFITLLVTSFITLSEIVYYIIGNLICYIIGKFLLHYRDVLHYRLIFITLSGCITLSESYYIIRCNRRLTATAG